MNNTTNNGARKAWKVAAAVLAVVIAVGLIVPGVSAKTGKFQVLSWSPPSGKRKVGILVVEHVVKGKKTKKVLYVTNNASKKIVKLQPGYIVKVTFKGRKGAKATVLGDATNVKIESSGSGDVFDSSAGGSENPAGGGGGT